MLIFKILRADEWAEFEKNGRTRGAPVDRQDGFVHFSTAGQLPETLHRHFPDAHDLVLVAMDAGRGGPWLKWEPSREGELFPHLYRDLESADVVWSRPLPDDPAGWKLPLEPTCA